MATLPAGIDFEDDDEIDVPTTRIAKVPTVRSTVTGGRRETRASDRLVRDDRWTAEQLRDYVIRMIGETSGAHLDRDPLVEHGIFTGFIRRHGADAAKIARWAFETSPHPGYWRSAPIRPSRFTKNADPYFATEILEKLR